MHYCKRLFKNLEQFVPEPRDVYEALQPLHIICQFVGLAPYRTVINPQNGSKTYEWTMWTIIRNIFLFILYSAGVGVLIYLFDSFIGGDIQEKLQHLQDYFLTLIILVSVSFACVYVTRIIEVFQKLYLIDGEFQELAVWLPYRRTWIFATLNVMGIILIGILILIWFLVARPLNTLTDAGIVELIVLLPFLLIGYLMESQYVHYFSIIKYRYSILNEYLEAVVCENKCDNGWVQDDKDEDPSEKIPQYILKSIETIADSTLVIERVANLHVKLSDAATLVNISFAVQFLFRITIAFINIVTALYMVGVNFSSPNAVEALKTNVNYAFTAWAGSSAIELLVVVWVTSATCEEANKCPQLMHKIRNATKNAKLQDVIEMYSLQMYHNRLQFYICGLFPLDFTLLHTIVAGVTTYLVILIQFNSANTMSTTNTTGGAKQQKQN